MSAPPVDSTLVTGGGSEIQHMRHKLLQVTLPPPLWFRWVPSVPDRFLLLLLLLLLLFS
jgi:hypothetical protein